MKLTTHLCLIAPLSSTSSLCGSLLVRHRYNFAFSFSHQWLYSHLLVPGLFFSFVIFFSQRVGLLGRVISYLHIEQHKHRINAHTDIHALSGIRNHDSSVRASEDSSFLRPHGHCDRPQLYLYGMNMKMELRRRNKIISGRNENFKILSRMYTISK
jgi:hypothetical protein